ncbi:MAG TPA: hypothetical protein VFW49_13600 [Fluviicoccus sp.]|nr:hypothetical protein [Fluviicoccus sp.]
MILGQSGFMVFTIIERLSQTKSGLKIFGFDLQDLPEGGCRFFRFTSRQERGSCFQECGKILPSPVEIGLRCGGCGLSLQAALLVFTAAAAGTGIIAIRFCCHCQGVRLHVTDYGVRRC